MRSRVTTILKFRYSEKATKFCKFFILLVSYVVPVKSKVKISQNFVAFSEYLNFIDIVLKIIIITLDHSFYVEKKFIIAKIC